MVARVILFAVTHSQDQAVAVNQHGRGSRSFRRLLELRFEVEAVAAEFV